MQKENQRIAARFAAAVDHYDEASSVQRQAADLLATQARALPLPAHARVLEIGCGTGHLSARLLPHLVADWLISDIALPMAQACRARHANAQYIVMDGEALALARGSVDLIVSNLAMQWFADLPQSICGLMALLRPGGHLLFTTLGAGTFAEWQAAHTACGYTAATPRYPRADALRAALPGYAHIDIEEDHLRDPATTAMEFLRGLRAIGAQTPRAGVAPLNAGQLRRVLRALPAHAPQGVSYCLLRVCIQKPAA